MPNIGEISDLKVAVSTSTAKNSYKAGREIAKRILQKINCNPDIIFLFCTMDYDEKEYGGLTEILKGVWEVLPENIKLVGGTVPGFLNTDGCYARGVTALAISYPNMNISIGFGKNTKRNPKKAANQAVKTIKTNLKNEYKNKMIFSIISGTKNPDLPGVENTSVITSKIKSKIMLSMFSFFQKAFQLGFGREHELLEEVIKQLPEYSIIHSSSYSLPPFSKNFQFFNKQVLDECAVIVAIDTDMDFDIDFRTGAKKIIDSKITKISKDQTVVKKLNYNPPLDEYIKKLGWNYDIFNEFKWTDIGSKYPFGYYKNNHLIIRNPILILGQYLGFLSKIEEKDVFLTKLTPDLMLSAVDEILTTKEPYFGFFTSCIGRRDLLGIKVFKVQQKMKEYFKDKDFLVVYSAGEGIYKPDDDFYYLNETITSAIFKKNN